MINIFQSLLSRLRFVPPIVALVAAYAVGGAAADKPGWMQPARKLAQIRARVSGEDEPHDIQSLRQRAEAGDVDAQNKLAVAYADGVGVPMDLAEAAKWFRLAAEQGYAIAQCNLGFAYAYGDGVPENKAEAAKWFRLAAEQGYVVAQRQLCFMHINGEGVPEDHAEAAKWFRLAAEQGYVVAQHNLGAMYGNGTGVTQDYREAYIWLSIAAANGKKESAEPRDQIADKLPPAELIAAQKEAAKRHADIRQKMAQGGKGE